MLYQSYSKMLNQSYYPFIGAANSESIVADQKNVIQLQAVFEQICGDCPNADIDIIEEYQYLPNITWPDH